MRISTIWGVGLVLGTMAGWASLALGDEPESPSAGARAPAPSGDPKAPLPELVLVAPGTQVDRTPPTGWTHLVLKSVPRLASGDLDSLPGSSSATATLFRTIVLADVRPVGAGLERRFVLRRIGLGLCTPVRGRDTVVMTRSLQSQGIELGMIERTVLERAEQQLGRGRLVARTPTFALFSAPALLRNGNAHQEVLLRYALLVDPSSGALRTLVWEIARDPSRRDVAHSMVQLAPGLVYDCGLDVIAERLFGAVPVSWSFAIRNLPPGQPRPMTVDLQAWSVRDARSQHEAGQFENALRLALSELTVHRPR